MMADERSLMSDHVTLAFENMTILHAEGPLIILLNVIFFIIPYL